MTAQNADDAIRYEPDEPCPPRLALGVGAQGLTMVLVSIVAVVAITVRASDQDDLYLAWAIFASLVVSAVLTALQATRWWRFGAGHILIMGPTPNYVAVSVLALTVGGPGLLASLTVATSLCYLALASHLPLLRRIVTPTVSGTVLMLIAASILPIAVDLLQDIPEDTPAAAGPVVALVTLIAMLLLTTRLAGLWRVWSPLLALAAGCVVAAAFGAYDLQPILDSAWAGLPDGGLPGLDLTPGPEFLALLPGFVVVALVVGMKNIGDCVAIQQVSRRQRRATDFRLVQGSLATNGLGIVLSGLAGTPPTTVYSSFSSSLVQFTGVAARAVGFWIGGLLATVALLPKVAAVLLSIPSPVLAAYVLTAIGLVFVSGIQTVIRDGLSAGKTLAVGVAFALGVGLDNQTIGTDMLGDTWGLLIDNGMLVGAVVVILITRLLNIADRKGSERLEARLHMSALAEIDEFLARFASRVGWKEAAAQRLRSAGEEALMSLLELDDTPSDDAPRLIVKVRLGEDAVEMEFLAVFDEQNLEDRLAYLSEESQGADGLEEGEISLRLLRHYASAVHHQKFHGLDVVTVHVGASG